MPVRQWLGPTMDFTMTRTLCAAGPIPVIEGRALNVHDRESIAVPPRLSVADPLSGAAHPAGITLHSMAVLPA